MVESAALLIDEALPGHRCVWALSVPFEFRFLFASSLTLFSLLEANECCIWGSVTTRSVRYNADHGSDHMQDP